MKNTIVEYYKGMKNKVLFVKLLHKMTDNRDKNYEAMKEVIKTFENYVLESNVIVSFTITFSSEYGSLFNILQYFKSKLLLLWYNEFLGNNKKPFLKYYKDFLIEIKLVSKEQISIDQECLMNSCKNYERVASFPFCTNPSASTLVKAESGNEKKLGNINVILIGGLSESIASLLSKVIQATDYNDRDFNFAQYQIYAAQVKSEYESDIEGKLKGLSIDYGRNLNKSPFHSTVIYDKEFISHDTNVVRNVDLLFLPKHPTKKDSIFTNTYFRQLPVTKENIEEYKAVFDNLSIDFLVNNNENDFSDRNVEYIRLAKNLDHIAKYFRIQIKNLNYTETARNCQNAECQGKAYCIHIIDQLKILNVAFYIFYIEMNDKTETKFYMIDAKHVQIFEPTILSISDVDKKTTEYGVQVYNLFRFVNNVHNLFLSADMSNQISRIGNRDNLLTFNTLFHQHIKYFDNNIYSKCGFVKSDQIRNVTEKVNNSMLNALGLEDNQEISYWKFSVDLDAEMPYAREFGIYYNDSMVDDSNYLFRNVFHNEIFVNLSNYYFYKDELFKYRTIEYLYGEKDWINVDNLLVKYSNTDNNDFFMIFILQHNIVDHLKNAVLLDDFSKKFKDHCTLEKINKKFADITQDTFDFLMEQLLANKTMLVENTFSDKGNLDRFKPNLNYDYLNHPKNINCDFQTFQQVKNEIKLIFEEFVQLYYDENILNKQTLLKIFYFRRKFTENDPKNENKMMIDMIDGLFLQENENQ